MRPAPWRFLCTKSWASIPTLLILIVCAINVLGDEAKTRKPEVSLSLPDYGHRGTMRAQAKLDLRLAIKGKADAEIPGKYHFTFERRDGEATIQAGRYIGTTEAGKGPLRRCHVSLQVPRRPGEYRLVIEPIPVRGLSPTAEERVGMVGVIAVVK